MCKNSTNTCSWLVAMDKAGEIEEAGAIFSRMVDARLKKDKRMESEYSAPLGQRRADSPDIRDLERLSIANDRLNMVIDRVDGFLARFNGQPWGGKDHTDAVGPVPSGYRGQLDAMFEKLTELEKQSDVLTSLG